MAKEKTTVKRYTMTNALITGIACGALALIIGYLIETKVIKHQFDVLFAYGAVGILITLLNFKPLSKLAIFLLPPVYAFSGFGIVAGALLMAYLGWEKNQVGDTLGLVVENVPFFIFASILYNWYSSLAGKTSFSIYAIFAVTTVVVSMLIFKDQYPIWMIQGCYLGIGAFLFSLLHLRQPL